MSTTRPTLTASRREITGKQVAHLRRSGRLPGVVFGRGTDSIPVTVDAHEFDVLRRRTRPNTLVDLSIDGKKPQPVLVHGVQTDRIRQRPLHVDLFLVRMTEELTVDVPLVGEGSAPAVEIHGGTLLMLHESLRVRALPDHLPQSVTVPLAGLVDFDAVVRVSELTIPADVTLLTDLDDVVAKVQAPRVEEEPVAAVAEGEEAEAGEAEAATEGEAEGATEPAEV